LIVILILILILIELILILIAGWSSRDLRGVALIISPVPIVVVLLVLALDELFDRADWLSQNNESKNSRKSAPTDLREFAPHTHTHTHTHIHTHTHTHTHTRTRTHLLRAVFECEHVGVEKVDFLGWVALCVCVCVCVCARARVCVCLNTTTTTSSTKSMCLGGLRCVWATLVVCVCVCVCE